jgi:hypothetical protein
MQHMPDKDFDKLFRDQFMDAEIEPSADLWSNIADKLEPSKKRSFPLMWVAAASVAVVAAVMLFTQSDEKILLRPNAIAKASVSNESNTAAVPVTTVVNTPNEAVADGVEMPNATKSVQAVKRSVAPVEAPNANEQKNIFASVQPSETNDHLVIKDDIKRGEVKPLEVIKQEKVTTETQTNRMIAAAVPTKDETTEYIDPVEDNDNKKGIRNVGDLVNYVVDKVDKREKKLIKFNTDDDDNSSIIGLNIGFLKLNRKNNK